MARTPPRKIADVVIAEKALTADQINIGTLNMGESPLSADSPLPVLKPPRNLPPRNGQFVGRKRELRDIHKRLSQSHNVGVTQQAAAHGHGGVGKTSLAVEYAWKHIADYPGGLFILNCDTELMLPAVSALAEPLGLALGATSDETARRVKQRLEAGERALLVLDNVRNVAQWCDKKWSEYLPAGSCRRLITTRAQHLAPGLEMVPVERLPRPSGVKLLAGYRTDAGQKPWKKVTGDIVDWFDGLAVGLTVVGAYMARHSTLTWRQYADSLSAKDLGAVRATEDYVGPLPDYDKRVDAVFDELLESLPPEQQRALYYAALLPEDNVVPDWLAWLLEKDGTQLPEPPPGYYGAPGGAVVAELRNQRILVTRGGDGHLLSVHRVLRRRLQERLEEPSANRNRMLDSLGELAQFRGDTCGESITNISLRGELTALIALARELRAMGRFQQATWLANCLATPLRDLGWFAEGLSLLSSFEDMPVPSGLAGETHGTLLGHLGLAQMLMGDVNGALVQMNRSIQKLASSLPADHPKIAVGYHNLAFVLRESGDLSQARNNIELALAIQEKQLPNDDSAWAARYGFYGCVLQDQGYHEPARTAMERAIQIVEQTLPAGHPTLATHYCNLGMLLHELKDHAAALGYMKRAIEIIKNAFSSEHHYLATDFSNLALILRATGDLAGAYESARKAIQIGERVYLPDNPALAHLYRKFALVLGDVRELERARQLLQRALEIDKNRLPPNHLMIATDYSNLGNVLFNLGLLSEACACFRRALPILAANLPVTDWRIRQVSDGIAVCCNGAPAGP